MLSSYKGIASVEDWYENSFKGLPCTCMCPSESGIVSLIENAAGLTHSKGFTVTGRLPTVAMRFSPGGCIDIGGGVVLITSRSNGVAGTAAA